MNLFEFEICLSYAREYRTNVSETCYYYYKDKQLFSELASFRNNYNLFEYKLPEVLNTQLFSYVLIAPLIATLDVHYLVQVWLKCSLSWVKMAPAGLGCMVEREELELI